MSLRGPLGAAMRWAAGLGGLVYLALGALLLFGLISFFDTWSGRLHFIAGVVLLFGTLFGAGAVVDRLLARPDSGRQAGELSYSGEALASVFGVMAALVYGVAAAFWPTGFISEHAGSVVGITAFFLGLISLQMFVAAILAGGFKLLVWRPLENYPWVQLALIGAFFAFVLMGGYFAITD